MTINDLLRAIGELDKVSSSGKGTPIVIDFRVNEVFYVGNAFINGKGELTAAFYPEKITTNEAFRESVLANCDKATSHDFYLTFNNETIKTEVKLNKRGDLVFAVY